MKKIFQSGMLYLCAFLPLMMLSQQTFHYRLSVDFKCSDPEGPDLIQIENNDGLTGMFTTRTVPATTCLQGGTAGGYFFEDDAGLQLNIPEGFIEESYSLSLIFQIDEFITPPPWVRILSFTHVDDHGIYIKLTGAPTNGTLEFWPNGTVGENNFFNTEDFYQMILVRDAAGLIRIYVNGTEFSSYDDSQTQEYKPHPPDNYLIFFRDHPSVLADEASPGFVSNITLTNQAWDAGTVAAKWADFCSSLLNVPEPEQEAISLHPNPAGAYLSIELPDFRPGYWYELFDMTGKKVLTGEFTSATQVLELSGQVPGFYFLRTIMDEKVTVSKVIKR